MRFGVGDTVAFRRAVAAACNAPAMQSFRAVVTQVCGDWVFLREPCGRERVMPAATMCKVGRNGAVLELVQNC